MIYIPEALVLGTNTPHGINVLSDFIEEITGHKPEFHESGWTTGYYYNNTIDEYIHNPNALTTSTNRTFFVRDGSGSGSGQISYEDDGFIIQFPYGYLNGNGVGYGYGYFNGDGRVAHKAK